MDIRVAGAQIPVSTNIKKNKQEIFKAIDWAKENEIFLSIYILIIGLLLISNLPTFSSKQFKIKWFELF